MSDTTALESRSLRANRILLQRAKLVTAKAVPSEFDKKPFVIALCNMTDFCCSWASTRPWGSNDDFTKLFPIPTTCKTCDKVDPSWCFKNRKFKDIMSTDCPDRFELLIGNWLEDGDFGGAVYALDINDCKYVRGVLHLVP